MKILLILGMLSCALIAAYHVPKEQKKILAEGEVRTAAGLEKAKEVLRNIKPKPLEITKATMYVDEKKEDEKKPD